MDDMDATGPETTPGPRVRSEVYITPATKVEMYDFGTGVGLRIGEFYESYAYIGLGHNAETRRDTCDRLITVLTACRDFIEDETDPEAVPA